MKNVLLCFVLIISAFSLSSQTTIAKQSFEDTGDTWSYTASPTFGTFTDSGDDWQIEDNTYTDLDNMPTDGTKFVAGQDIANGDNPNSTFVLLNFADVSVSGYSSIEINFDYQVEGLDNGDDLFYTLTVDGVAQPEFKFIDGASNLSISDTETITIPDGSETVSLQIKITQNGSDYVGIDNFEVTGTLPTTPVVGFDNATSSENETDASFNIDIPVTLSNHQGSDVILNVAVSGGTAEPTDYVLNTSSLTFSADGSQNVSVTINDDADFDDETVEITLTETSSEGAVISTGTHTLTIVDDELPIEASFSSPTSTVSETNADVMTSLSTYLANSNGAQVDIMLEVTGGTAEPEDYDLTNPTFSLNAGDGIYGIPFTIKADADSDDETIEITMTETSSTGAIITIAVHTITIEDDETPPIPALVINEVLADPPAGIAGDANGDGTGNTSQDEFIEIINTTNAPIDISGYRISDGVSVRHVFPEESVVPAGWAITVFGGGSPSGIPGVVQTASTGQLGFNNSGDNITLDDGTGSRATIATFLYGSEGGNDESLARDVDITGTFVAHSTINGGTAPIFSPGRSNTSGAALPVELGYFEGALNDNYTIELAWSTLRETNNDYFIVLKNKNDKFVEIGKIIGAGDSYVENEYHFTDRDVHAGMNYYTLVQYDYNGNYSHIGKVSVEYRAFTTSIYPTLTKAELNVEVADESNLNIVNNQGQLIRTAKIDKSTQINVSDLAPGVYYLQLNTNGNVETHKFVKL